MRLWSSVIQDHNDRDAELHKEIRDKLETIDIELRNGLKLRMQRMEDRVEHHLQSMPPWWQWIAWIIAITAIIVGYFKH